MSWWKRLSEIFDDDDAPPLDPNEASAMADAVYNKGMADPAPAASSGGGMGAIAKAATGKKDPMKGKNMMIDAVYVHNLRPNEPMPVTQPFRDSGSPAIDVEYRRRMEEMIAAMRKEYQEFSQAGLAWFEKNNTSSGDVDASRAAEDAEIARKRAEEDAARAARRAQEDAMRAKLKGKAETKWRAERDAEEKVISAKWSGRIRELQAAFEESIAAHEAHMAELERQRREEEARAKAAAAALAAQYAQQASINAKMADDEARNAELDKLKLATQPSLRSFKLIGAADMYRVLQFMCSESSCSVATAGVKESDKSWWKVLHFLEGQGLTPPVKGSELSAAMFEELDADKDGVIPLAELGFTLSLLCSGTIRQKMEGAWDCLGQKGEFTSPSTGPCYLTREQVYQCLGFTVRCREQSMAAIKTLDDKFAWFLIKHAKQPDANSIVKFDNIEAKVAEAFRKLTGNQSEQVEVGAFRDWAESDPEVANLFMFEL